MLFFMTRLLLIILCATFPAFAAQDAKPEKLDTIADVHKDIEYQKFGNVALKLDLCQPKDRPKAAMPVILWFHGGGWNSGIKEMNPWRENMFIQHGYCFVSVE